MILGNLFQPRFALLPKYGRVDIVMPRPSRSGAGFLFDAFHDTAASARIYSPDETLAELSYGVAPSETKEGDYLQLPEVGQ